MVTRFAVRVGLLALLALGIAGCGYTPGERALSGGALGAGAGAAIGAVSGGSAGAGALIGGGVGALGGALTAP
jgi:osmotically inducible lipoprotein OsmB